MYTTYTVPSRYCVALIIKIIIIITAANKVVKYGALSASHTFTPVAVETAGTWNQSAIELIQEIGRRISAVMEDTRETVFLVQRLSIALQGGMRSPSWLHLMPCDTPSWSLFLLSVIFTSAALC